MGYFEDLTKAFDVPLVAFGNTNGIKVALENIDAPTSTDTPYLASYMLLADTEQAFKAGKSFSRNDICAEVQSVSLGPLIVENGWAKRPLSINFIAFTKRL